MSVRDQFGPRYGFPLLSAYPQAIGLTQLGTGHAATASLNAPSATYLGNQDFS